MVLSNYVIAFIDLLGQKEEMLKYKVLTAMRDHDEEEKLNKLILNTFSVIEIFQNSFSDFIEGLGESSLSTISQLFPVPSIKLQRFSDGLVVFMNLRSDQSPYPFQGVYVLLMACSKTILEQLYRGFPVRGGIELGIGLEMNEGEIYGPCVAMAYDLESENAKYPRIVVGEFLADYIRKVESSQVVQNSYERLNINTAKECLNLITKDNDGIYMIDFMGGYIKQIDEGHDVTKKMVLKIIEYSQNQFLRFQEEGNEHVKEKYRKLNEYINSRKHLWIE